MSYMGRLSFSQFIHRASFSSHTASSEMPKVYAVCRGRSTGIFSTWDECKEQVNQYSGAVFKSFSSVADAENYMREHGASSRSVASAPVRSTTSSFSRRSSATVYSDYDRNSTNSPKRIRLNECSYASYSSSTGVYARNSASSSQEKLVVYTDGSCLGNGQQSARAGYGAFYGHNDPRNISAPLTGPKKTNQRAELTAVSQVLKRVDRSSEKHIQIRSDSMYTINAATVWMDRYVNSKGPKNKYENLDLMMDIYNSVCDLKRDGVKVDFEYVAAHNGTEGNEMADQLAKNGALQS